MKKKFTNNETVEKSHFQKIKLRVTDIKMPITGILEKRTDIVYKTIITT